MLAYAKPVLTTLLLPPVPLLVLALWGGIRARQGRRLGLPTLALSLAALWFSHCQIAGRWLLETLLSVPAPLQVETMAPPLRLLTPTAPASPQAPQTTAIVVLGGGRTLKDPAYQTDHLSRFSLERLAYGIWLTRKLQHPLVFSGGTGWANTTEGSPEASIARQVAADTFGVSLAGTEAQSRDTQENARFTLQLAQEHRWTTLILVTHAIHMPRALREFQAAAQGTGITVIAAPMGFPQPTDQPYLDWLPSSEGLTQVRSILKEWLALTLTR